MLRHISSYTHAVATTPAEQLGALVARLPQLQRPSLVYGQVGFRITLFEACSAFTHVTACVLAKSPKATLYTGGFSGFVASTTAPIATGWSDPCRVGFAPTEDVRLSTAHRKLYVSVELSASFPGPQLNSTLSLVTLAEFSRCGGDGAPLVTVVPTFE